MELLKRPGAWEVIVVIAAPMIIWLITRDWRFTLVGTLAFTLGSADAYRRRRRNERRRLNQQPRS